GIDDFRIEDWRIDCNSSINPKISNPQISNSYPFPDSSAFGHDDDPAANVVAVAVVVRHARFVHEPGAIPDGRVLVDDDAVEHHVGAYAETGHFRLRVVDVGSKQYGPLDLRFAPDVCPDANHRVLNGTLLEEAPVGDKRLPHSAGPQVRRREEAL